MDVFEKCLFEGISGRYAQKDLSAEEYEEIYNRLLSIGYLDEVKPYLYAMRFFGWGTTSEKAMVLAELADALSGEDYVLKGLCYDLLLSEKSDDPQARINLHQMVQNGYTNIYTKDRTNIGNSVFTGDCASKAVCGYSKVDQKPQEAEEITCSYCGYGLEFGQKETEVVDEPCEDAETVIYEVECACGQVIEFGQKVLEEGSITCLKCGEILIFTMEDEENEDPDQDDDDSVVYEVECACGTLIEFDQQTLEAGEVICPTCGDVLEIYLE